MDPQLQALFEANQETAERSPQSQEQFTQEVMQRIEQQARKTWAMRLLFVLGCLVLVSFFTWPVEIANIISHALTAPILNFGEGWAGWILSPINNSGALILLLLKLLRTMTLRSGSSHGSLLPF